MFPCCAVDSLRKFLRLGWALLFVLTLCFLQPESAWSLSSIPPHSMNGGGRGGLALHQPAVSVLKIDEAPLTWNVIGLDSDTQRFIGGPRAFLAGARLKNTGDTPLTNLVAVFSWVQSTPAVQASEPLKQTIDSLAPGDSVDVYFNLSITDRYDDDQIKTLKPPTYQIRATSGAQTVSLQVRLLVQSLAPDTNDPLPLTGVSGPKTVQVGETVHYVARVGTLKKPYQVLSHQVNFPAGILRILSMTTSYENLADTLSDRPFYNACGWPADLGKDPASCTRAGVIYGSIVTTYTVQAVKAGAASLVHTVIGTSGGQFYYLPGSGLAQMVVTVAAGGQQATTSATPTRTTTLTLTPNPSPTSGRGESTRTPSPSPTSGRGESTRTPASTATRAPATSTATVKSTATPTLRATVAPTLAPATATAAAQGLILHNAVNPSQASVGAVFTFTLRITNSGALPTSNILLTDTFSAALDLTSATVDRGKAEPNTAARIVRLVIPALNSGESATLTVITLANNSTKANTSFSSQVQALYLSGGGPRSATSNSVSYRILTTPTLPGTGSWPAGSLPPADLLREHDQAASTGRSSLALLALACAVVLSLLGGSIWLYSVRTYQRRPLWTAWYRRTSRLLGMAALLFLSAASALYLKSERPGSPGDALALQPAQTAVSHSTGDFWRALPWPSAGGGNDTWWYFPSATPTSASSDAAGPTSTGSASTDPASTGSAGEVATSPPTAPPQPPLFMGGEKGGADLSPIVRLSIPALKVDLDALPAQRQGVTWAVANITQDVAWLTDSSLPGAGGNTVLAAHVTLNGGADGPFRHLTALKSGDLLHLTTQQRIYTYRMRARQWVVEDDLSVIAPSTKPQLTLITCDVWDMEVQAYLKRVVVYADLVEVKPLRAQDLHPYLLPRITLQILSLWGQNRWQNGQGGVN